MHAARPSLADRDGRKGRGRPPPAVAPPPASLAVPRRALRTRAPPESGAKDRILQLYCIVDLVDRNRGSRWIQLCNFEDFFHLSYIAGTVLEDQPDYDHLAQWKKSLDEVRSAPVIFTVIFLAI